MSAAGRGSAIAQALDEVAGAELARRADPLLDLGRPALRDVLPREVDDRVAAGERVGRGGAGDGVPADCGDPLGQAPGGTVGAAGESGHLVTAADERLRQPPSDATRRARQRHPHAQSSVSLARSGTVRRTRH